MKSHRRVLQTGGIANRTYSLRPEALLLPVISNSNKHFMYDLPLQESFLCLRRVQSRAL